MNKKRIGCILLVCAIIVLAVYYPSASAYTAAQNINSGEIYFVKNKNSGKYLDVEHGVDANGTNVSQYQYNGKTNQKWKVNYVGNGLYNLIPMCSSTRMLDIYNANDFQRANVDIWIDGNQSPARRFAIVLNQDGYSYRLLSQCSNYTRAVTVEGRSCTNGANVFQYTYNGTTNDEWILQPAGNKSVNLGVNYALRNAKTRPVTYPNFLDFGNDCTNFVSQCMLASGIAFRDEWMVNKKNNTYQIPKNATELDNSWELKTIGGIFGYGASSPWISADKFKEFWTPKVKTETFSGQYIYDHPTEIINKEYVRGDVVQILNGGEAYHAMYITDYTYHNNKLSYALTYHSSDTRNKNLLTILEDEYYRGKNFRFYKMV